MLLVELAATLGPRPLEVGARTLVAVTAQTSLLWFLLAFVASPLVALRPSAIGKWLLRNRRYLGLAMAVSHAGHLLGIIALTACHGAAFWATIAAGTAVGGTVGYVLLAAMTATSTDRSAAWLGRRRWRALHRAGMWSFWTIFLVTYLGKAGRSAPACVAVAALLGVLVLRGAAARRRTAHASRARRP